MYRHIDLRGRISFCINSALYIKRFPLKGESVKGGSTVVSMITRMNAKLQIAKCNTSSPVHCFFVKP